jgi:mRNA interferase RelE/StbE
MNQFKIEFKKAASKFIRSRSPKEQQKILTAISILPNGTDIKKLEGYTKRFRLRLGGIRIIYEKYDDRLLILIIEAGQRGDIYK